MQVLSKDRIQEHTIRNKKKRGENVKKQVETSNNKANEL